MTQHELMRLFEGDITTDILNSTYMYVQHLRNILTPKRFSYHILSKVTDNLILTRLIILKIYYQDIMAGKFINLYTSLTLRTIGLKNNCLSLID